MDKEHPEIKEAEELKISQQLYQPSPDTTHYFAFVLDKKINTNQLVFNIINFNLDHFDNLNLIVEIIESECKAQSLVTVKTFKNQRAGNAIPECHQQLRRDSQRYARHYT